MKKFQNKDGVSTSWLSVPPTEKELSRLNTEQILILAKRKKGFKKALFNFLTEK